MHVVSLDRSICKGCFLSDPTYVTLCPGVRRSPDLCGPFPGLSEGRQAEAGQRGHPQGPLTLLKLL